MDIRKTVLVVDDNELVRLTLKRTLEGAGYGARVVSNAFDALREIGLRLALGAEPAALKRMFVKYGLVLTGIGIAIGLVGAAGLTRLMSSLLFGTGPLDPATYVAVLVVLTVAAVLASYLPARRAAMVNPMTTLAEE